MMTLLRNRYLHLALRLLIGGIFVYASWDKVLNPQQFAISVRAYQIVPISISNLFAIAVAWSELFAGVMLIVGIFPRAAAGSIFILLAMFIGALSTVLVKGMVIDCGCFKSDEHSGSSVGLWMIFRNVALLIGCWVIIQFHGPFMTIFSRRRRFA